MQLIEIKSADTVRDAIICIVDPKNSVSISRHMHHPHTHAVHTKCKCVNRAIVLVVWCMQTGRLRRYYGRSNARSLAGTLDALLIHDALQRAHINREHFVRGAMTRRGS